VKGGGKIIFKSKPISNVLSIKVIKSAQCALFQEIKMPAQAAFPNQVIGPRKLNFFKTFIQRLPGFRTESMKGSDMV
jgi:hypothetical protein